MVRKRAYLAQEPMRRTPLLFAVLLALAMNSHDLIAQASRPSEAGPLQFPPLTLQVDTISQGAQSWGVRLASGLAAAAIGAGLGFFASQLATGDWEEDGGQDKIHRSTWAAVGGTSGFA